MNSILENSDTIILKSEPILFTEIPYDFNENQFSHNFKIYLLQVIDKFVVYSPTYYLSDDNFTSSLESCDRISYPLSLDLYSEFNRIEEATEFYDTILAHCPTKFDLTRLFGGRLNIYGRHKNLSVHYDTHTDWEDHSLSWEMEFVRYGYQRIMVRMFLFNTDIIINNKVRFHFEKTTDCFMAFQELIFHFHKVELFEIPYKGKDTKTTDLLEKLASLVFQTDEPAIQINRDFLRRITKMNVYFNHKNFSGSVRYELPTRNGNYHGYTTKSNINISLKKYKNEDYNMIGLFESDLEGVIKQIEEMLMHKE